MNNTTLIIFVIFLSVSIFITILFFVLYFFVSRDHIKPVQLEGLHTPNLPKGKVKKINLTKTKLEKIWYQNSIKVAVVPILDYSEYFTRGFCNSELKITLSKFSKIFTGFDSVKAVGVVKYYLSLFERTWYQVYFKKLKFYLKEMNFRSKKVPSFIFEDYFDFLEKSKKTIILTVANVVIPNVISLFASAEKSWELKVNNFNDAKVLLNSTIDSVNVTFEKIFEETINKAKVDFMKKEDGVSNEEFYKIFFEKILNVKLLYTKNKLLKIFKRYNLKFSTNKNQFLDDMLAKKAKFSDENDFIQWEKDVSFLKRYLKVS